MYVCVCHAVTENEVVDCVIAGASSVEAVGDTCGAGTACGACKVKICDLIREISELNLTG